MKKKDVGKNSRSRATIKASRAQVTNGHKAPPAIKRSACTLTPQQKTTWLLCLWGGEFKFSIEEADYPLARPGKRTLF
ncbi:MAG: hypothetical protein AB7D06_06345 [Pedobacter sp.]|jgi:hypothetical protein